MNFEHAQRFARPAAIHAFVDAQPGLSPAERAFMRLSMLRDGIGLADVTDAQACTENCEDAR